MPLTRDQAIIKRATRAAQTQMNALDAQALRELERIYIAAAAAIREQIAARAAADGNVPLTALRDLLAQAELRLRELGRARDALLDARLESAATLGVQPFAGAAGAGAPAAAVTGVAAMRIRDDALVFVRTFVAADGLQLSDRLWRLDRHARDRVSAAIEQAVVQGASAEEAARAFLARGEPVPAEIAAKRGMARGEQLGRDAAELLTDEAGSPMDNALRVFRTELNRAHGIAYQKSATAHPEAIGTRFLLSPAHPRPDICDLLATQNLYGLGPGVYPPGKSPWPAHPNTLSYEEVVFRDEVSDTDHEGKETPLQALERLPADKREGALGKHKEEVFREGKLRHGMIRSPWRAVERRLKRGA